MGSIEAIKVDTRPTHPRVITPITITEMFNHYIKTVPIAGGARALEFNYYPEKVISRDTDRKLNAALKLVDGFYGKFLTDHGRVFKKNFFKPNVYCPNQTFTEEQEKVYALMASTVGYAMFTQFKDVPLYKESSPTYVFIKLNKLDTLYT